MSERAVKLDFDGWLALQALYADCAAALDARDLQRWPQFFTEDARYTLQSRENHDRGLPLAVMALESRAMMQDRVVGAFDTIYHHPYHQRHVVGAPRILRFGDRGALHCEASYVVVRTKRDALPEILSVGRSIDTVVATADGLRFAERLLVFDNDLIANSIIDPI